MRTRRYLAGLVAAGALLAGAAPALGHVGLASSTPKKGAVVAKLPATVKVKFSGLVQKVSSAKLISDQGHNHVKSFRYLGASRTLAITTKLRHGGRFKLTVVLIAADGDRQTFVIPFRVKG